MGQTTSRLSLKQCRVLLAVAKARSESDAASTLFLSQSSISRNILAAERNLDCTLFRRGWGGADPTGEGEFVLENCRQIVAEIERTEGEIARWTKPDTSLSTFLEWRHLDVVASVVTLGSASAAAGALGISQPAVSRAIRDLEHLCRQPLFVRRKHGLESTDAAVALADLHAIITPMSANLRNRLTELTGTMRGRLYVGMLPISCQYLIPMAFGRLIDESRHIQLHAMQAPYRMLTRSLRSGEIDCFIGLTRGLPAGAELQEIPLLEARYGIIARSDHPLLDGSVALSDLTSQRWIVAPHGTPVRAYFEQLSDHIGEPLAAQTIEMLTFRSAEQMIQHSDAIALLAYATEDLARLPEGIGLIDVDLPESACSIGITVKRGAVPVLVKRFIEILEALTAPQAQR